MLSVATAFDTAQTFTIGWDEHRWAAEFARFLAHVDLLDEAQRTILHDVLSRPSTAEQRTVSLLDGAMPRQCPACGGERIGSWGRAHGLPRYRCRECHRTFNALTGSPLARLRHREAWMGFGIALQEGQSTRRSAATCGVARSTAFRWRHRFLSAPRQMQTLSGLVEADETFFRRSYQAVEEVARRSGLGVIHCSPVGEGRHARDGREDGGAVQLR